MDDQRTNRRSGNYLIPIVRLVSLMLLGVLVGFIAMPAEAGRGPDDLMRFAKETAIYTVSGAIVGLLVELGIRWRGKED